MKKSQAVVLSLSVLSALSAQAKGLSSLAETVCKTAQPQPEFEFRPRGWPSFIFNMSPDGRTLCYHRSTTILQIANSPNPANACIDVDVRGLGLRSEVFVPGMVDAFQTEIDGDAYITMPRKHLGRDKDHWGLPPGTNFYRWAEIERYFFRNKASDEVQVVRDRDYPLGRAPQVPREFNDPQFLNHYHTIGTFKNRAGQTVVRVMNDLRGASIRDYEIFYSEVSNSEVSDSSSQHQWKPGPVINLTYGAEDTLRGLTYFDLPTLSKDGQYFTVYDRRTMTTKMFAIENGKKREELDFGIETGKVAFDHSGSRVAFHVDFIDSAQGDKVTGVKDMVTKDVMVLELEKYRATMGQEKMRIKDFARLTLSAEKGEGSYYPSFDREGKVYFIHGRGGRKSNSVYTFVKVDPDQYRFEKWPLTDAENSLCPDCSPVTRLTVSASAALGNLYAQVCTKFVGDLSGRDSALVAAVLDSTRCRELVAAWNTAARDQALGAKSLFKEKRPHAPSEIEWVSKLPERGESQYPPVTDRDLMGDLTSADLAAVCPDRL